ncbi:hypothetical protein [Dactylosporangium matsuzakiense]|uniref:Uncharacterized protein n=1 Tax=Dactylosporangium matsuzakiense TaxID=53360 RepID=A0A9W6KEV0_9ACTN|nr:hypothetical protein [Dactylosporangium matsuzakiense]UWZ45270.1 hypothetical protein Dmats_01570 [Dactylosporangium matsuzakiense]GLK98759.1 hypothetical protein GCM10017581_005000 [Dactylosporangium matsuzakiense]
MHGWRAWLDLAIGPNAERTQRWNRRDRVLQRAPARHAPRRNQRNREIVGDLARIDISGWLSVEGRHTRQANVAAPTVAQPTVTEQVEALAEGLARAPWERITAELADPVAIGREFADHGWCDLLVGLVRGAEAMGRLDNGVDKWMQSALISSSRAQHRPKVDRAVAELVADRVWEALAAGLPGTYPWLTGRTGERELRSLRVLAVFMCPAPEAHAEVREHALGPAIGMVTDRTRELLTQVLGL